MALVDNMPLIESPPQETFGSERPHRRNFKTISLNNKGIAKIDLLSQNKYFNQDGNDMPREPFSNSVEVIELDLNELETLGEIN